MTNRIAPAMPRAHHLRDNNGKRIGHFGKIQQ